MLRFWLEPDEGFVAEVEHVQSGLRKRIESAEEVSRFIVQQDEDSFLRLQIQNN